MILLCFFLPFKVIINEMEFKKKKKKLTLLSPIVLCPVYYY